MPGRAEKGGLSEEEINVMEEKAQKYMPGGELADDDAEKIATMSEVRNDTNEHRENETKRKQFKADFYRSVDNGTYGTGRYYSPKFEEEALEWLRDNFGEDYASKVQKPSFDLRQDKLHPFSDHQKERTKVWFSVMDYDGKSHGFMMEKIRKLAKDEMTFDTKDM